MALFQYNDIEVRINNSGILANNASIETRNNLEPIYILGKKGIINQSPQGLISNVSLNYYLDTNFDPGFDKISFLRTGHNNFNYSPDTIVIGGITGQGFLTNYSVRLIPGNPIEVSIAYSCFEEISGTLTNKLPTTKFNITNSSGLAHADTSFITNTNNYTTGKIYDLDYSCDINWNPIQHLGTKFPSQIQFISAQENFQFTREYYSGVQFSGQSLTGYLGFSDSTIDLYGLGYIRGENKYLIQIPISGAKITSNNVEINLDDFARVRTEAINYY